MDSVDLVHPAFIAIKYLREISDGAEETRHESIKLCAHSESLLDAIRNECQTDLPQELHTPLSKLTNTLLIISSTVEEMTKRSRLQRILWREDIAGQIQAAYRHIYRAKRSLNLDLLTDIHQFHTENEDARKQDTDVLHQHLELLLQKQSTILDALQVESREYSEAMLAICRRLASHPTKTEQEVLQVALGAMQRRSSPSKIILDEFVITSLDIVILYERKLGEGGYSKVYEGNWKGTRVAVKELEKGIPYTLIQAEIDVWKRLRHPNILEFFGGCSIADPPFIVSALKTNGHTLEYLYHHPDASRRQLLHDASVGLVYLHQQDVIHGDLKATNILVDDRGRACLADFGVSRLRQFSTTKPLLVKNDEEVIGTLRWMSPETMQEGVTNKQTDVYSFGMTIYEMYTGRPPFANLPEHVFFNLICNLEKRPPRPDNTLARQMDDAVWTLITRCWAQLPQNRCDAEHIASSLYESADSEYETLVISPDLWEAGTTEGLSREPAKLQSSIRKIDSDREMLSPEHSQQSGQTEQQLKNATAASAKKTDLQERKLRQHIPLVIPSRSAPSNSTIDDASLYLLDAADADAALSVEYTTPSLADTEEHRQLANLSYDYRSDGLNISSPESRSQTTLSRGGSTDEGFSERPPVAPKGDQPFIPYLLNRRPVSNWKRFKGGIARAFQKINPATELAKMGADKEILDHRPSRLIRKQRDLDLNNVNSDPTRSPLDALPLRDAKPDQEFEDGRTRLLRVTNDQATLSSNYYPQPIQSDGEDSTNRRVSNAVRQWSLDSQHDDVPDSSDQLARTKPLPRYPLHILPPEPPAEPNPAERSLLLPEPSSAVGPDTDLDQRLGEERAPLNPELLRNGWYNPDQYDREPSAPPDWRSSSRGPWYQLVPQGHSIPPVIAPQQDLPNQPQPGRVPVPPGVSPEDIALIRENRLALNASFEHQREISRYMRNLNNWLARDVHDRQDEIRAVAARTDQLRELLVQVLSRQTESTTASQPFPSPPYMEMPSVVSLPVAWDVPLREESPPIDLPADIPARGVPGVPVVSTVAVQPPLDLKDEDVCLLAILKLILASKNDVHHVQPHRSVIEGWLESKTPFQDFVNYAQSSSIAADKFFDILLCAIQEDYFMYRDERSRRTLMKASQKIGAVPSTLFLEDLVCLESYSALGLGSFADVYRGSIGDRRVALKRLRIAGRQNATDSDDWQRPFYREALLWRQLQHPHILEFIGLDSRTLNGTLCMISPWMENGDLATYLASQPDLPLVNRCEWIAQVADAVCYINQQGIIHGDLRGANVLLDQDLQVRVSDFGLSTFVDVGLSTMGITTAREGAVRWMAPEVIDTGCCTGPGDVYSFGCVCLEIITGKSPLPHLRNDKQVIYQISRGERPNWPEIPKFHEITGAVGSIARDCWHEDPADRPSVQRLRADTYRLLGQIYD